MVVGFFIKEGAGGKLGWVKANVKRPAPGARQEVNMPRTITDKEARIKLG